MIFSSIYWRWSLFCCLFCYTAYSMHRYPSEFPANSPGLASNLNIEVRGWHVYAAATDLLCGLQGIIRLLQKMLLSTKPFLHCSKCIFKRYKINDNRNIFFKFWHNFNDFLLLFNICQSSHIYIYMHACIYTCAYLYVHLCICIFMFSRFQIWV